MNTKRAFFRFLLCAGGLWFVVVALLSALYFSEAVPFVQVGTLFVLATLLVGFRTYDEYRRMPLLPEGFRIVGRHMVTPAGVYCNDCNVLSKIDERIPFKDSSKTFVYVYKCPSCRNVDYIDQKILDKEPPKC